MKDCQVQMIPVPAGYKHPAPVFDQLPTHEFTMGLIAPKGCGKTTVICNLLKFYAGYFHTILVFSPTILSDEKWDWVKAQKLLVENTPLKKWLRDQAKKEEEDTIVQPAPIGQELEGLVNARDKFTGYIPEEHFFDKYDDASFMEIMEEQKTVIDMLKKMGEPKYLANRILIIFDDLVGSALFSGSRGSYFKGVNTRHRHYSSSFLMVSQGYKEIPKTIRTNWTCLIVFAIGNEREVFVIYEEFAMGLNNDNWLELYRYATEEDHSFLYINFQKPRRLRMMKNFMSHLWIEEGEDDKRSKKRAASAIEEPVEGKAFDMRKLKSKKGGKRKREKEVELPNKK